MLTIDELRSFKFCSSNNHKDDHVIEKSDMPDDLIRGAQGFTVFEERLPMVCRDAGLLYICSVHRIPTWNWLMLFKMGYYYYILSKKHSPPPPHLINRKVLCEIPIILVDIWEYYLLFTLSSQISFLGPVILVFLYTCIFIQVIH